MKQEKTMKWISNFKAALRSTILCIRFPFLWPRNRWTGKHYNCWPLIEYVKNNWKKGKMFVWLSFHEEDIEGRRHLDLDNGERLELYHPESKLLIYRGTKLVKEIETNAEIVSALFSGDGGTIKVKVKKIPPSPPFRSHTLVLSRFWVAWLGFLQFLHDWPLQIIHAIPTYTELDSMEGGWRKAFGLDFCKDLREAARKSGIKPRHLRIMQIKEKYGSLTVYLQGYSEEIDKVLRKYERLSRRTCVSCGKPATKISRGWISPYCDDCIGNREYDNLVTADSDSDLSHT